MWLRDYVHREEMLQIKFFCYLNFSCYNVLNVRYMQQLTKCQPMIVALDIINRIKISFVVAQVHIQSLVILFIFQWVICAVNQCFEGFKKQAWLKCVEQNFMTLEGMILNQRDYAYTFQISNQFSFHCEPSSFWDYKLFFMCQISYCVF